LQPRGGARRTSCAVAEAVLTLDSVKVPVTVENVMRICVNGKLVMG